MRTPKEKADILNAMCNNKGFVSEGKDVCRVSFVPYQVVVSNEDYQLFKHEDNGSWTQIGESYSPEEVIEQIKSLGLLEGPKRHVGSSRV